MRLHPVMRREILNVLEGAWGYHAGAVSLPFYPSDLHVSTSVTGCGQNPLFRNGETRRTKMAYNLDSIYNSSLFNLTSWRLTLPVDSTGGIIGTAVEVPNLTGYESSYF